MDIDQLPYKQRKIVQWFLDNDINEARGSQVAVAMGFNYKDGATSTRAMNNIFTRMLDNGIVTRRWYGMSYVYKLVDKTDSKKTPKKVFKDALNGELNPIQNLDNFMKEVMPLLGKYGIRFTTAIYDSNEQKYVANFFLKQVKRKRNDV